MRTAKKTSSAKSTTKAKAKAPKAVTKSQRRTATKSIAKGRKAAPVSKAKAAPTSKAKAAPTSKAKSALRSTAKTAPKSKATPVAKSKGKPVAASKPKAAAKRNGRARPASALPKSAARSAPAPRKTMRRDATGHLDPKYARDLRALSRENHDDHNDRAFFQKPRSGDDLAEELGEEAVETMTSGEDQSEHLTAEEVEEERGGPFVKTRGDDEFASGTDRSNPSDATREPFPRT